MISLCFYFTLGTEFSPWPLPGEGTRIKGPGASNIPAFYPHFKQKFTRIVHAFWANWTRIKNSQHCILSRL
jgi:hypothetical protein